MYLYQWVRDTFDSFFGKRSVTESDVIHKIVRQLTSPRRWIYLVPFFQTFTDDSVIAFFVRPTRKAQKANQS